MFSEGGIGKKLNNMAMMALDRSPDLFFVIGDVNHNNTVETKIEAQQCSIAIDLEKRYEVLSNEDFITS